MDGVLSDFMTRYRELNGDWKRDREGKKSQAWHNFCTGGHFAGLDTWPGSAELLQFIEQIRRSRDINVEILTSTGGAEYHERVTADKQQWCEDHGIFYKVNTVPGRWIKQNFCRRRDILIDDTADVIDQWRRRGGVGILHTSAEKTIDALNSVLDFQSVLIYN